MTLTEAHSLLMGTTPASPANEIRDALNIGRDLLDGLAHNHAPKTLTRRVTRRLAELGESR